ncbi:hypothetical protein OTU49_004226 [Cherax quadricarinatus]|uniref:Methyltransferase domain-containing protein n=1 Tax=Cherax quadricarinatus TaxID=27406 RepID=A0AAW0WZJ8_CHEQU|nr:uncharacterized protein LOC128695869 [Cherax quadricarinatus]
MTVLSICKNCNALMKILIRKFHCGVCVTGTWSLLLVLGYLLMQHPTPQPREEHESLHFLTRRAYLVQGKYLSKYLPYVVVPVVEETLVMGNVLTQTSERVMLRPVTLRHSEPPRTTISYLIRVMPPMFANMPKDGAEWKPWGPKLKTISDYFRYLQTPQTSCHKLIRLGGSYCIAKKDHQYHFDGHKYVCVDSAMELLGNRDPQACLVLSFGTERDTSFDESASVIPCEIHMFDVLNYNPELAKFNDSVYFHVEGLSDKNIVKFYSNLNITNRLDTLRGHIFKHKLFPRPINILKVDIEDSEWEAFRDIAQDPLFDIVGQVAIEVHALQVAYLYKTPEEKLRALQDRYDVLRMIEARGFRRVLYWDNDQSTFLYDDDGTKLQTVGELLYVNTNWYNMTFKKELAAAGITYRRAK